MYRYIDVWKRVNDTTVVRYRCFQRIKDNGYCVQSADYYSTPIDHKKIEELDTQFLELLIEQDPDERSGIYETLEEAIAMHEKEFSNGLAP